MHLETFSKIHIKRLIECAILFVLNYTQYLIQLERFPWNLTVYWHIRSWTWRIIGWYCSRAVLVRCGFSVLWVVRFGICQTCHSLTHTLVVLCMALSSGQDWKCGYWDRPYKMFYSIADARNSGPNRWIHLHVYKITLESHFIMLTISHLANIY